MILIPEEKQRKNPQIYHSHRIQLEDTQEIFSNISILPVKKLRHKEVNSPTQEHTSSQKQGGIQTQNVWFQSPSLPKVW